MIKETTITAIIRLNKPIGLYTEPNKIKYITQMSPNPNSCVMATDYKECAKIFKHKRSTLEKMIKRIKMHDPEIIIIE